jgi:hypothetical protein
VRRLPGQAARGLARLLHLACTIALTMTVLVGVLLAVAAWRLSQGPVDLAWLTQRIEAAANADGGPTTLSIGATALAWEGFSEGVDRPVDLRFSNVTVTSADGRKQLDVPRTEVSLSIGALLRGRFEPRAVELDQARLTIRRAPDGTTSLDLGTFDEAVDGPPPDLPAEPNPNARPDQAAGSNPNAPPATHTVPGPSPVAALLAELVRPATNDRGQVRGMFSQLRRVRVTDASVVVLDRQLGTTWNAPHANIDLTRRAAGGVDGIAALTLALGDQTAVLTVTAALETGAAQTHLRVRLTPVAPAALAKAAPKLAPLAALDAPVGVQAAIDLGPTLQLERGRLTANVGKGAVQIGDTRVALQDAVLVVNGTPDAVTVETMRAAVLGHEGAPPTVIQGKGTIQRDAGRLNATVTLDLDQLAFADLPRVWPAATGGGARPWLVENVTTGVARNGHAELSVEAIEDLSTVNVTTASGTLDGDDLTVHWLRPVPPLEQGTAKLRILDPDTLEIAVSSARQRSGKAGLALRGGKMRITGLSKHDQYAAIQADIAGSVADTITLLKEPRLGLLDKHPIDMRDPAGDATAALTVTLPLDHRVTMDDVTIHAVSHLTQLHLGGLVAGRDLDQGAVDLDATADGLTVKGKAQVAGIASQLDVAMDFRTGPPSQVILRAAVSGHPNGSQLAAAGLDTHDAVGGDLPVKAAYTQHRAGNAEIAVEADLTPVVLAVSPIAWQKPAGVAAKGTARVLLDKDKLRAIDRISIDGDGLSLQGAATLSGNRIVAVRLDRAVFGRNDLHGSLKLPDGGPITAELAGPSLDLSAKLAGKTAKKEKSKGEPPPGPAWALTAQFDRVLLAGDRSASAMTVWVEDDGRVMRVLHLNGQTGGTAPFALDVTPAGGSRKLSVTAADAGALLQGLNVVRSMDGGTLSIKGTYDDVAPGHKLTGTAEIDNFRLRGTPGFGKLLQAMTLYGLVDVLRGPGIGITHLIAPFRLDDDGLTLNDARAFSPSLGLTAKGRIDLANDKLDLEGTIVPAYFFNSLLGNIPLIGRLFSPEEGGGLFAARYALRGEFDDPSVSVNPLSALTPGFLREIFGLF